MSWVWAVAAVWLLLGAVIGVLIGRGIRLADRKAAAAVAAEGTSSNFVVDTAVGPFDATAPDIGGVPRDDVAGEAVPPADGPERSRHQVPRVRSTPRTRAASPEPRPSPRQAGQV